MGIVYSAPGSVYLSGEHTEVYGKPTLISAFDERLTVEISKKQNNPLDSKFDKIITTVQKYLQDKGENLQVKTPHITVSSTIPVGRGLGLSGALSVAASAALMDFFTGKQFTPEEVNNCAYRVEKLFHKNPSGVDPTTSCFGGLIFYRKEFEFLKTISSLNLKIPKIIADNLLLVDSGKPEETTAQMVEKVGKLYNRRARFVDQSFQLIEKLTKRLVVSLAKEDGRFFRDTIEQNQKELVKLGVVSEKTKKLIERLKAYGTGKITGAGGWKDGSGFILFYTKDKRAAESFMRTNNISFFLLRPTFEGVRKIV